MPPTSALTWAVSTMGLLKSWVVGLAENVTVVLVRTETDKAGDAEPAKSALPP